MTDKAPKPLDEMAELACLHTIPDIYDNSPILVGYNHIPYFKAGYLAALQSDAVRELPHAQGKQDLTDGQGKEMSEPRHGENCCANGRFFDGHDCMKQSAESEREKALRLDNELLYERNEQQARLIDKLSQERAAFESKVVKLQNYRSSHTG
jgi:hypothetical protein